jgi:signal transduction histidine kinase
MQLPPSSSRELRVLADTFNNMLDRLALAFEGQRQFVADASHELRTPLTVMRGQLDVLVANDPSPDEVRRVERLLQAELARVTRLVNDLLLLAQSGRADFLRLERVELDELVTEIWDGLSLTATRTFQIAALTPVVVTADPDRLAQALRNLARNAIAHTREPDGIVRVELATSGELVRLSVSDDGPGIPPAARERVFERFYRTDPARSRAEGGAGLGLAIVRAIVEAHQGTIRVTQSELGGARFELELPRAPQAAPPATSGPAVPVVAEPAATTLPERGARAPERLRRPGSSARPQA